MKNGGLPNEGKISVFAFYCISLEFGNETIFLMNSVLEIRCSNINFQKLKPMLNRCPEDINSGVNINFYKLAKIMSPKSYEW